MNHKKPNRGSDAK